MKTDGKDRRKKYTRMVLKNSLMELMKEKPISKISIKEICENADINRCTFYSHYTDQYDLLQHIEREIISEINEMLANYNYKDNESEAYQMLCKIFDYIAENSSICTILLSEKGDINFQKEVMMIVQKQCVDEWTIKKSIDTETAEYLYFFAINGSIGIVQRWLKNNLNKSTREMADLVIKLTNQGLAAFV